MTRLIDVTLLRASLKAICGFIPSRESCALRATFHFGPLRASAIFASEGAGATFGTLDWRAVAQFNCEETAGPTTTQLSLQVAIIAINL
jgi:hypothetical protein